MRRAVLSMFLLLSGAIGARAEAALFLEEPFGSFGGLNPTGHSAIYLSRVCAASPILLRRCEPGETGIVISRYHRVAGHDWIAIPLIAYLYAVEKPDQIPAFADAETVNSLRDNYRRAHLLDLVPNDPNGNEPKGDWTQLVGEAYDRKIYSYEIETTPQQDDRVIKILNSRVNRTHFNLFFYNCADFARYVLNLYYPKAIHRNFTADIGIMTPKQAARCLVKYSRRNSDLRYSSLVIQQVPGTLPRSRRVDGVLESFVRSKKYVVPVAVLHPIIAGSVVAAYLTEAHFEERPRAGAVAQPQGIATELESNGGTE